MAYDHRVFRHEDDWWVAQVSGGGAVGANVPTRLQWETVFLTCISDVDQPSRGTSIAPGRLNRMSHRRIVDALQHAKPMTSRFEMFPYNAPSAEDYQNARVHTDSEDLKWVVTPSTVIRQTTSGPEVQHTVDVICLDDSALRKTVLQQDTSTYEAACKFAAGDVNLALIEAVKGLFDDSPVHDDDDDL